MTQATHPDDLLIIGGGIGGLTLALMLERAGLRPFVFEAAAEIKPIGVGINLLPHAMKELSALGLEAEIARRGIATREAAFFNRFGQLIYREPLGRAAGYDWPQISIHRGDLHLVLLKACRNALGPERVLTGWQCVKVEQDEAGAIAHFVETASGKSLPSQRGRAAVGCDGIHSVLRKQFFPDEGEPHYTGINMWRGVTRWPPILSGATMTRAGWFNAAKLVIYPIRDGIDAEGRQLTNWLVEVATDKYKPRRDWNRPGRLEDFIGIVEDWHFDWLDAPAFFRAADVILEYPMVDQEPLPRWSFGRATLLGDAAHPMVPRGSNGAGQAILDCRALAECLTTHKDDAVAALRDYEARRRIAAANVVLTNRKNPPDAILREVYERTGDKPFARIEDVISAAELQALSDRYKRVAGYDKAALAAKG
ncbi:MAG TPA: flavin-dependent oxidoreductase [Alphaproteobacteria bacterium]|nr:flavin-dependent oxidoreductase [Alphaproteobacteria bacterium]